MANLVAVFQGYDSVAGMGLNTAVEGEIQSVGGTSFVKADICTSSTELMDSLQIDQSLAVGYAGVVSVSEKMQLLQSLNLTTFSTSIVVFARHTQGHDVVTGVRLRHGVAAPTSQDEQLRDFVATYGDSYLSSCTMGGEYYAVYTYYSTSKEQQFQLQLEMEAAGLFKGVNVDASLQTKISRLNKSQNRRVSFQQRISGIANPTFPPSDDITDFALKFPSMELTAPKIIQWTTSGYEIVPGIGRNFKPVARNRELLAGRDASMALSKLRDLQEGIKALQDVYSFYGGYAGDTKLNNVKAEAEEDERRVRDLVAAYGEDPTQPVPGPLALKSIANGSPSLEYVVQVFGESKGTHDNIVNPATGIKLEVYERIWAIEGHGHGHGHTEFDDVDLTTYIDQHRKITGIQLRASRHLVNCIIVTYMDDKGTVTVTHGSHDHDPASTLSHQMVVRPGHSITTVSGQCGQAPLAPAEVVTSLHIGLDNGEFISGGASVGPGALPFAWTSQPDGTFLLGFRGRKGWFIDVLQLVYASFRPANWFI